MPFYGNGQQGPNGTPVKGGMIQRDDPDFDRAAERSSRVTEVRPGLDPAAAAAHMSRSNSERSFKTPKKYGSVSNDTQQEQVARTEISKVKYKLIAGRSNLALASAIAETLGVDLMDATVEAFNDGESKIQLIESVRNIHVYVIQSTCPPVNDNLLELFLMVRCLRRASASSITAIIPYFGYARQDRKMVARVPISASDVAIMLEKAGIDRLLAVDLHCGQIQGFFHQCPVDNLSALREMAPYVVREIIPGFKEEPIVVVSPDAGGVARAKMFMECLTTMLVKNIGLAITVKHRAGPGEVEGMNVVGEIDGKHCIIVDDMIDTAGTLCKSAETLMEMGAKSVSACATHGLLTGPAIDRIEKSCMQHVIVSDSIPLEQKKIRVVSIRGLIAEAIQCMTSGQSVSGLFSLPSPALRAATAPQGAGKPGVLGSLSDAPPRAGVPRTPSSGENDWGSSNSGALNLRS